MSEKSLYLPAIDPDKYLKSSGSPYDLPVSSTDRSMYLTWMFSNTFITVEPELSVIWVSLGDDPIDIKWKFDYQYHNKESWLGYFKKDGSIVMNFDDGRSEVYSVILESKGEAEKDIIQATEPHKLMKKDRRSGTLVTAQLQSIPVVDDVYFMGTQIRFTEDDIPREPRGRKRKYKPSRWELEPYG